MSNVRQHVAIWTHRAALDGLRLNALGEIEVRTLTAVIAFLLSLPVSGSTPIEVWFDNAGTFDANRILSGVFTASGAFDAQAAKSTLLGSRVKPYT
jgi:hypothetical protein